MYLMDFVDWINSKFLEWQTQKGRKQSLKSFAIYLSVPLASLSDWMNGKYTPRNFENIKSISEKLGNEVYELLGLSAPERSDFRDRLELSVREALTVMIEKGVGPDTPEGEQIIAEIADRYGFETKRTSEV